MEEIKIKVPIVEVLKIDSLRSRWVARVLFIVVFLIYTLSTLYPIGDPDLSKYFQWLERYQSYIRTNPDMLSYLGLPVLTKGNILFIIFRTIISYVYIFIAFLYTGVYLSDRAQMKARAGLMRYLSRLPALISWVIFITILFVFPLLPLIMDMSILIIIVVLAELFFVVPSLFLSPALILHERKSSFESIIASIRKTQGIKLSILTNLMMLGLLFIIFLLMFSMFINPQKQAFQLVFGYFFSYLVLAFGRLIGYMYETSVLLQSETSA